MRTKTCLEFTDAEIIAAASKACAEQLGLKVTIAVVDDTGALLHVQRLDGAKPHSVDLAHRKARTAVAVGLSTGILERMAQEGRLQGHDILALAGGMPVIAKGQCAGGVGVSGASAAEDEAIAEAGLAALAS